MLLNLGSRQTTQDIDFFPLNFEDTSTPDKTAKIVTKAIRAIAKKHTLKREWCSDAVNGITGWMQPPFEELTLWGTYGALEIYMPDLSFILASKIFGGRDKDINDILALCQKLSIEVREQAQAILDRYIDKETQDDSPRLNFSKVSRSALAPPLLPQQVLHTRG
jgi:hypothetical protein